MEKWSHVAALGKDVLDLLPELFNLTSLKA